MSEREFMERRGRGGEDDRPEMQEGLAAAIGLANVTLASQDEKLNYLWIENPPEGYELSRIQGRSDADILPPDIAAIVIPAKREAMELGERRRVEFQLPIGGVLRWYELQIEPRVDARGKSIGVVSAALDISDRKQSESHLRVLLLELAHRSKNLLAVIQGIANQTGQGSTSIDEFNRRFSGRLMSLSRAHDILSDQNWRGAGMRELIRTQVLLFAGNTGHRISYEGEPVYLRPNAAQHVGLALYELTANALRHGALSGEEGVVLIRWSSGSDGPDGDTFTLTWKETKGPAVAQPRSRHFGRILLEEVVPFAVQGEAQLDFSPQGVRYSLTMPMSELN